MSIKNLKIKNFKSLGDIDINIDNNKKVICFVGENGSSKTSILNLIVDAFITHSTINFLDFQLNDKKRYRFISAQEISELSNFYTINFNYENFDTKYSYDRIVVKDNANQEEYIEFSNNLVVYNENFYNEKVVPEPTKQDNFFRKNIFMFRPSYRHEYDGSEVASSSIDQNFNTSIRSPTLDDFPYNFKLVHSGKNIESTLIELLLDSYIGYADSKVAFSQLPIILKKITNKDYGNFQIARAPYRRLLSSNCGAIDKFSQGELDLIVTITSIMERQLYIYNSYGFSNKYSNFLEVPGIVIIDEVDLHLHPKAQETYLKILTETFENIQFIITTHSPFVIRGLPENSIVVQLPTAIIIDKDFSTMDIDSISSHIFNLSGRFKKDIESDLDTFRLLIAEKNNTDIASIKRIYNNYKHSSSLKNELDIYLSILPTNLVKEIVG